MGRAIVLLVSGTWLMLFKNKKTFQKRKPFATYQSKTRTVFPEGKKKYPVAFEKQNTEMELINIEKGGGNVNFVLLK